MIITANDGKGLWHAGHLKHICPNVRRYKLLILTGSPVRLLTNVQKVSVSRNKTGSPVRYNKITDRGRPCGSITYVSPTCHKPIRIADAVVCSYFFAKLARTSLICSNVSPVLSFAISLNLFTLMSKVKIDDIDRNYFFDFSIRLS